jgi:two-component system phosphate regulon sensor histidine kinase PhoR
LGEEPSQAFTYQPLPYDRETAERNNYPEWRVRFEVGAMREQKFGLEINGEVEFGRGIRTPNSFDLSPYEAETLGVSRRHIALRPTATNLFVIDLGSTNGTMRNGRSIGVNTPYTLADGDVLTIGKLLLVVRISKRPPLQTTRLAEEPDLADVLSEIAQAITSQLNLDEVLHQVATTAMALTSAEAASIWLVHETTGELYLEAERAIDDAKLRRTRIPITEETPAGQVIKKGRPLRVNRKQGEEQPQLMTGYLVEALVHVPIALGGVTFGVLAAVYLEPGKRFGIRDERLLRAVADFAAIAIQNARLYEATDLALDQQVQELAALNEVSRTVSASLDLQRVYDVLVAQISKNWPVEAVRIYLVDTWMNVLRPLHLIHSSDFNHPMNKGIIGCVAQNGQTVVTNDVQAHPDYLSEVDDLDGVLPDAIACIPLNITNRVVGVLTLFNKQDGPFTEEDVSRLEAFAHPIATAIENARLFEESERQRAAIQATSLTLSDPLIVLDDRGQMLVSNEAANKILETNMSQLFDAVSEGVGRTTEAKIGEETYLTTTQHVPEVGTIIVMQNITYVKQLEKDRSDFMHMLSHDLKNPLMAVTGWSTLLQRTFEFDDKGKRYIGEIDSAADRMLEMVDQLLQTVSGDENIKLVKEPCDLLNIVDKTLRDVEGAALNKSIDIVSNQDGDPYLIEADNMRLYHMLLNLVDNAIKYSPPQTRVDVNLAYSREAVTIQVQDEGPGIPEKDLSRVFDKFFRGIQEGLQTGSGVGLSAVKNIVEAHGGTVAAQNGPKQGSIFTVTLPSKLRIQEN